MSARKGNAILFIFILLILVSTIPVVHGDETCEPGETRSCTFRKSYSGWTTIECEGVQKCKSDGTWGDCKADFYGTCENGECIAHCGKGTSECTSNLACSSGDCKVSGNTCTDASGEHTNYCMENANAAYIYKCENGRCVGTIRNCQMGYSCKNGACVKNCKVLRDGSCVDYKGHHKPRCSGDRIYVYKCENNECKGHSKPCDPIDGVQAICKNGECVKVDDPTSCAVGYTWCPECIDKNFYGIGKYTGHKGGACVEKCEGNYIKGKCGAECSNDNDCTDYEGNCDTPKECEGHCYLGRCTYSSNEHKKTCSGLTREQCLHTPSCAWIYECLSGRLPDGTIAARWAYVGPLRENTCVAYGGAQAVGVTHKCVKGKCGAECDSDEDCSDKCEGKENCVAWCNYYCECVVKEGWGRDDENRVCVDARGIKYYDRCVDEHKLKKYMFEHDSCVEKIEMCEEGEICSDNQCVEYKEPSEDDDCKSICDETKKGFWTNLVLINGKCYRNDNSVYHKCERKDGKDTICVQHYHEDEEGNIEVVASCEVKNYKEKVPESEKPEVCVESYICLGNDVVHRLKTCELEKDDDGNTKVIEHCERGCYNGECIESTDDFVCSSGNTCCKWNEEKGKWEAGITNSAGEFQPLESCPYGCDFNTFTCNPPPSSCPLSVCDGNYLLYELDTREIASGYSSNLAGNCKYKKKVYCPGGCKNRVVSTINGQKQTAKCISLLPSGDEGCPTKCCAGDTIYYGLVGYYPNGGAPEDSKRPTAPTYNSDCPPGCYYENSISKTQGEMIGMECKAEYENNPSTCPSYACLNHNGYIYLLSHPLDPSILDEDGCYVKNGNKYCGIEATSAPGCYYGRAEFCQYGCSPQLGCCVTYDSYSHFGYYTPKCIEKMSSRPSIKTVTNGHVTEEDENSIEKFYESGEGDFWDIIIKIIISIISGG